MTNLTRNNNLWHQIVIEDPNALPGLTIYNIIDLVLKKVPVTYVFLDDLVGAGTASLMEDAITPVQEINEFMKNVTKVQQFDWGDFFLFTHFPENWESFEGKKYKEVIPLTATTVRAVDDTYVYIYTPYDEIITLLEEKYTLESVKTGLPSTLDYPY